MSRWLLARFIRFLDWIEKHHPQPMHYKKVFWLQKLRAVVLAKLDGSKP
jgi:hypothetical protein